VPKSKSTNPGEGEDAHTIKSSGSEGSEESEESAGSELESDHEPTTKSKVYQKECPKRSSNMRQETRKGLSERQALERSRSPANLKPRPRPVAFFAIGPHRIFLGCVRDAIDAEFLRATNIKLLVACHKSLRNYVQTRRDRPPIRLLSVKMSSLVAAPRPETHEHD